MVNNNGERNADRSITANNVMSREGTILEKRSLVISNLDMQVESLWSRHDVHRSSAV